MKKPTNKEIPLQNESNRNPLVYAYTQSNKYPQGTWNKYRVPPTPPNTKIKQNHTNANYVT